MPWFKVDDGFAFHRKTIRAGNLAVGLWVRAGSWSAQQLTDGHVPLDVVVALGGTADDAEQLVDAGLWDGTEEGYAFRGWHEYQPSREAVEEEREKARKRKQAWRDSKTDGGGPDGRPPVRPGGTDGGTRNGTDVGTPASPTRPDPTRPVLPTEVPKSVAASQRGTRLSEDFTITEEMKTWAIEKGMTGTYVLARHETFMNHWPAQPGKAGVKLDWVKTWKNWMLRDFKPTGNITPVDFGGEPQRPAFAKDDVRARFQ